MIHFDPDRGLPFIADDGTGAPRLLACLPQTGPMALANFGDVHPIIPESEFVEIDLFEQYKPPILDQGGHGCHSEDTEVLTDTGWQAWPSLKSGSLLGTMNPFTHSLEFQAPTALHAYDYDGLLHYSTNRRIDFALTTNHRMYVRKWDQRARTLSGDFQFTEARNLGWYSGLPASTSGYRGVDIGRIGIDDSHDFVGDDFIALIAVVLSDGWAGGTENTRKRVGFCCFHQDRYQMVAALAYRLGFQEQPNRKGVWHKTDFQLAEWFRQKAYFSPELGARNKCIPDVIRSLGSRQIEHFLQFFGDQCSSSGNRTFYSSSSRLIDDLQELLLKIGKRGTICQREPRSTVMKDGREIHRENCGIEYTIIESYTDRLCIERMKHIETDHYKGPVFCATVPNSLLVTRRNKSVLISGNSCVGHGGGTAFTLAWLCQGEDLLRFSPCYLYGNINGGRDQGADIGQTIESLMQQGICLEDTVPEGMVYRRQFPSGADQEAAKYKLVDGYRLNSPEEMASALQMGWPVCDSVMVGGRFNNLDSNGVVGVDRGPGNHAIAKGGMKKINGVWHYRCQNSWSAQWGQNGYFYTNDRHIENQGYWVGVAFRLVSPGPNAPKFVA